MSFWWLSYAHGLGRAGLGAPRKAGRLQFVYARWYCKEGRGSLRAVHRPTQPLDFTIRARWRGPQNTQSPRVVSFRTGILMQDQGPPFLLFFQIDRSNFDTKHHAPWCHTRRDSCQLELRGTYSYNRTTTTPLLHTSNAL